MSRVQASGCHVNKLHFVLGSTMDFTWKKNRLPSTDLKNNKSLQNFEPDDFHDPC